MIRVLVILAAVAALAASARPATAGASNTKSPPVLYVANHTEGTVSLADPSRRP